MKKNFYTFLFLLSCSLSAFARTAEVNAAYTFSSDFNQADASIQAALVPGVLAGLQARWVEDKLSSRPYYGGFKNHIYSVSLPLVVDFDLMALHFTPFYYFSNKSEEARFQDASAFGGNLLLAMRLEEDTLEDLYTQAFISASYARQKGTLFKDTEENNQYYSQAAYTLGMRKSMYQAFVFDLAGSVFQYPDSVDGVKAFRGVLDQKDLAFIQTFDVVRELPKYTLNARMTRIWPETHSSLYVAYAYMSFHTAAADHSLLVGNTFRVTKTMGADFAYNHLQDVHAKNKRDVFYLTLGIAF